MDIYKVGLDIGSTTAKIIVLDKSERNVLFYKYERHQAKVQECLLAFFHQLKEQMGDVTLSINITGSVGMGIAEKYSLPFVQEVVAAAQSAESSRNIFHDRHRRRRCQSRLLPE